MVRFPWILWTMRGDGREDNSMKSWVILEIKERGNGCTIDNQHHPLYLVKKVLVNEVDCCFSPFCR